MKRIPSVMWQGHYIAVLPGFPYILKSRFLGNQIWSLCQKNMWEIGRPSINKLHKKDTAFVLFVGGTTMSLLLLQWWVSQWRSPALLLPISISFFLWGHHEVTEFEVILQSNLSLKHKVLVEEVWKSLECLDKFLHHRISCCHLIIHQTKGRKMIRSTCR